MQTPITLPELTAETEREIMRLLDDHEAPTAGLFEMMRYHLGLGGTMQTGSGFMPVSNVARLSG